MNSRLSTIRTMAAVALVRQGGHWSIGLSLARFVGPMLGSRTEHYRLMVPYQPLLDHQS
jgi:hypothetical protein